MIVRKQPNGDLLLIGQTDHSRLVGLVGAHWGNETFERPRPYDPMARAATFHDFGWLRYETAPSFDPVTGETPNFRDIPSSAQRLEEYQWCVDWLLGPDPYAGLIVNMHRTGLWRGRYGTMQHPPHPIRPQKPEVDAFVARNEARQEREKQQFDADEVWTNYRLLQVWDNLGLYFACAEPCDDYIEPVPVRYGGAKDEGVRMTLTPQSPRRIAFDPYPFGTRPLTVQLGYKRLPSITYPDQESFREAYFKAPTETMAFELVAV